MKIIIAPDKFKETLTSLEFCQAVQEAINESGLNAEIYSFPMSDGGDGFVEVMKHYGAFEVHTMTVNDPLFKPVVARYLLSTDGRIAVIEMAEASGLHLLKNIERNCMNTSSFGTGELILKCIEEGVRQIYLGLGGSASNDGGIGMAAALGYKFLNKEQDVIIPIGRNLEEIESIQSTNLKDKISKLSIDAITDVRNPLLGFEGAVQMFSQQKGAKVNDLPKLENGLQNLSLKMEMLLKKDISSIPGTGAAGGLGAGAIAFLNAKIVPGTDFIFKISSFNEALAGADLVITGEGYLDDQSFYGKLPVKVAQRAKESGIPVLAIVGGVDDQSRVSEEFDALISLENLAGSKEEAMTSAFQYVKLATRKSLIQIDKKYFSKGIKK